MDCILGSTSNSQQWKKIQNYLRLRSYRVAMHGILYTVAIEEIKACTVEGVWYVVKGG